MTTMTIQFDLVLNISFGKTHCELQKNDDNKKDSKSWTYCKIL
jgi:hypothetical protein